MSSDLVRRRVPSSEIEQLVGAQRHLSYHLGRAREELEQVAILHSGECKASGIDMLHDCPFSQALDAGVIWELWPDAPVVLGFDEAGRLTPSVP